MKEKFGIVGELLDNKERAAILADELITCKLPTDDSDFRKIVTSVQTHHHTRSCLKYNDKCRYGIPRPPSKNTFISGPPDPELSEEEKEKLLEKNAEIMNKAISVLEKEEVSNLTWEIFLQKGALTNLVEHFWDNF